MAKKATVNSSAAIREALVANPGKKPAEISAILKERGIIVTPQYVSNVKAGVKSKGKGKRSMKRGRPAKAGRRASFAGGGGGDGVNNGFSAVGQALELIKAAGGLDAARKALDQIEEIGKAVK